MLYQSAPDQPRAQAGYQFDGLYRWARVSKAWTHLLRQHKQSLLCMNQVCKQVKLNTQRHGGVQSVPLTQIRGSVGRCGDFDGDFRPLRPHIRERWIGVAVAHEEGVILPAVELVQINDTYFVVDGHHRVSVAKAKGQIAIDASVTVLTNRSAEHPVTPTSMRPSVTLTQGKTPPLQQLVSTMRKALFTNARRGFTRYRKDRIYDRGGRRRQIAGGLY